MVEPLSHAITKKVINNFLSSIPFDEIEIKSLKIRLQFHLDKYLKYEAKVISLSEEAGFIIGTVLLMDGSGTAGEVNFSVEKQT